MSSNGIVPNLLNYCKILRDDGLSYGDYVEQLTRRRQIRRGARDASTAS